MSTLGGSRGERNAKPKFTALDINRMYKNSRVSTFSCYSYCSSSCILIVICLQGESSEPSAQKNQVPRKHGMQILGKVPSARRPPANLPSLKAETNSSSSIITTTNTNTGSSSSNNSSSGSSATPLSNNNSNNSSSSGNNNNLLEGKLKCYHCCTAS